MKRLLAKIWVPLTLVALAGIQSFGIDASRAVGLRRVADSLAINQLPDTTAVHDSITAPDSTIDLVLSAKDTIRIPDSLKETDPFKYRYYIAIKDSTTRVQVRDSLMAAGDSLELARLDSLYIKDSTEVAKARHDAWYASLSRKERKKYDMEQALPALIAAANRKMEVKDSIRAAKDSIIAEKPRILQTFAVPDSMQYKRLITWEHDRFFHNINLKDYDTTYNYRFNDYPFFKGDAVNSVWLGVVGAPEESYDFFKRKEEDNAIFYTPYTTYSYDPESAPQFNTKTPYTELAYWGTLFANQEKEESNVQILTTQNITPEFNFTLEYRRYGSNGMLRREDTDNRSFLATTNYLGKRYLMHAGFIYNKVERSENGGVIDQSWIRDTTVDAREIEVHLKDAGNKLKKNTIFLDQSYRIPFSFINKAKEKKAEKLRMARRDSIMASGDSLVIEAFLEKEREDSLEALHARDTINLEENVTTAFIGHSSEYSVFRKTYTDDISASDSIGRAFYHDRFFINPTQSMDSLRVMKFENRAFIRLQPWKSDGIVSKLDVGIGDKLASYFSFKPQDYLTGSRNVLQNSVYLYAGANGQLKKYMKWDAKGQYTFLGHEINDFDIDANLMFSVYPFRRHRNSPLTFRAHFETSLEEPDYYQQHLFTNHFRWDNDFSKISTTKAEASLSIPRWQLAASFGYALLSNNIYYDNTGIVRQNTAPMSVMTASLKKNFKVWNFHFDHKALFQLSSNEEVMPLPMLALNFRYYFQFNVVRNVMQMQIGANGTYTTKWYLPAYNPVLGVFHNQNETKYGNCPYIDAFVNIQWKRACIFIKAINVNMGWPSKSADYFTADGYIAPQRAIKFGISWPFYMQPGNNKSTTKGGAAAKGGSKSGGAGNSGMPSGLSAGGLQNAQNFRR
ncbi:MAG: putative porin [Bacteroidales bacterium]|nr:putative porin [Bacteroidales bacterium]